VRLDHNIYGLIMVHSALTTQYAIAAIIEIFRWL
jgi:hypothetical protein